MKIILFLFISSISFAQINYYSIENRKAFADYLFCQKDYLRAALEYKDINANNDSLKFKEAIAYININDFYNAKNILTELNSIESKAELKMIFFEENDFDNYNKITLLEDRFNKLDKLKLLLTQSEINENELFANFNEDKKEVNTLLKKKKSIYYKNKIIAGLLSAIIPGSGKIYTESYTDGIFSLVTTSILGYLSYDNFKAGHEFRGYLFAGLGTFFYAGNIYGSIADANLFNIRIDEDFLTNWKSFLHQKNYYRKNYEFCK